MKYEANVMINNELELVKFDIDGNPVEYLWGRYGMDSYIERVDTVDEMEDIEV